MRLRPAARSAAGRVASYGSMLKCSRAVSGDPSTGTRFRVIASSASRSSAATSAVCSELRPDLVVSVHPLLVYARQLIDASGLHAPLVTVITDLVTIHHSWTAAGAADQYVVVSPEARGVCADRGIPLSRIHDLGLPIRSGFEPGNANRGPAKRALDLDPSRQTLLVMAGGEGGGRVPKLLRRTSRP